MPTETTSTLSHQLSDTLQKLRSDLENVQREVDQALTVWRLTLINERKEAQNVWQEKEKNWTTLESEWQNQKGIFENKIQELDTFYKAQILTVEQNALQALNELDDSWQRDKSLWNQTAGSRLKDSETRESMLAVECQKREANEALLESRIAELTKLLADKELQSEEQTSLWQSERNAYENKIRVLEETSHLAETQNSQLQAEEFQKLKTNFERDRLVWQESLQQTLQKLSVSEKAWADECQKQNRVIHQLETRLAESQKELKTFSTQQSTSEDLLRTNLTALDNQMSLINEVFDLATRPTHPLRRRTDGTLDA